MEIQLEWLVGLVFIPVIGFFFKMFLTKFETHDNRMDNMEKEFAQYYTTREEWRRELDRTNKIVGELYRNKADKELVGEMLRK
jgi:hypothetical protein